MVGNFAGHIQSRILLCGDLGRSIMTLSIIQIIFRCKVPPIMPNDDLQCLYTTAKDIAKHCRMFVNRQRTIVVTVSTLSIAAFGKLYLESNTSYLAMGAIVG